METALDPDICYRALETRDARFDGRFFVGVTSTGVFCRPICPARTPKLSNCVFWPCAAAARDAGFRPCLRCRPETSPGTPAWSGTSATVSRALRLIGEGALDGGDVTALAERLGLGDRQLRRLFLQHVGTTPAAVARTRRLLFAKQLIDDTNLPMSQLALVSGYGSVRRFNDAISVAYGRPPSDLRRVRARKTRCDGGEAGADRFAIDFRLSYRKPFDWPGLMDFFALRAMAGIEEVSENGYARTIRLGEARGRFSVTPIAGQSALRARLWLDRPAPLPAVADRVRTLFDLRADPVDIDRQLSSDPRLATAIAARPGGRVPGAWDPFELAVRAILGQQISVAGATTLAVRLAKRCGEPLPPALCTGDGKVEWLFPTPDQVAGADLSGLGLTGARTAAIRGLAEAVCETPDLLSVGRPLDEAIERLCALRGVGPWTAQYIAMRVLGEPDAFPVGDLVLRQRLGTKAAPVSHAALAERAEAWRPWRAYAALLLWAEPQIVD